MSKHNGRQLCLAVAIAALALSFNALGASTTEPIDIVLVHGALMDGSTWRGVYDVLTKDGYHVTVVQQPLTGLAEDVAATTRVIEQLEGKVVLVGHSYGGTVITVAGSHPKVKALVYVAALQPDVGETTSQLSSSKPGKVPTSDLIATQDGFLFVQAPRFPSDVGADLPVAEARFLANAQMPVAAAAFQTPVTVAAWHDKPCFGVVATEDLELSSELAHWMYSRSGTKVTEIKGSHLVYISKPRAVANVIEAAARSVR